MAVTSAQRPRPKYLSLWAIVFEIRLPLTGWVSLLHRISGVMLVAASAWLLYVLDLSLVSETGFHEARTLLAGPFAKSASIFLLWAFCHHFFAGIRFLLIDLDIGVEQQAARQSGVAVLGVTLLATVLLFR